MWDVECTDEFVAWFDELSGAQQVALTVRIDQLEREGPLLRRPTVGEIKGSAFDPQMKELICDEEGSLRVLFIFDPRRSAILLIGGDKTGRWNAWYRAAIPEADRLYWIYLEELRREGLLP